MPNPEARWLHDSWWVGCERNSDTAQAASPIMFRFMALHESHREITAEVIGSDPDTGQYYPGRVTLMSPVSRRAFLKEMHGGGVELPAPGTFERACWAVVEADRRGAPSEPLTAEPPSEDPSADWLVPGWMPKGQLTVVYGDGGASKSAFCLAIAIAGLAGIPLGQLPGIVSPTPWVVSPLKSVMYFDWEMDKRTHARRLHGLCTPLGINVDGRIQYKRMQRSYADSEGMIRTEVARSKADLTICDSYTVACGVEPESADAANRTLAPMGNLPGSKIATGHISRQSSRESRGAVPPLGSVQVRNIPKSAIFMSSLDEGSEDGLGRLVTFNQTKNNLGPEERPTALRWAWDTKGCVVVTYAAPDPARMSNPAVILSVLKRGRIDTVALGEETGIADGTLRKELARLKKRGDVIDFTVASGGRGKKQQWGLVDRNRGNIEP